MPDSFNVSSVSIALPASAGSANTAGIQVSNVMSSGGGEFSGDHTFTLVVPALNTTQLPHNATATYAVQHDFDPAFGTVATLYPVIAQQTGSTSSGAAGQTVVFRLPYNTKTYVRVSVTTATSPGDCSAASTSLTFSK